jgi:hypothetical protein
VGRPIVKEQQQECSIHHALILDTFLTDAQSEIFEKAIAVAISYLTQAQPEESLLDVIFSDQQARCVTVGIGLRQRAQILETVATLVPNQTQQLDILSPIIQARSPRWSGCFCILITLDEMRYAFLRMLAQYGIPIKAIFLYAPNRMQLDSSGYDLAPQCHVQFISIDNMQQDLLLI